MASCHKFKTCGPQECVAATDVACQPVHLHTSSDGAMPSRGESHQPISAVSLKLGLLRRLTILLRSGCEADDWNLAP